MSIFWFQSNSLCSHYNMDLEQDINGCQDKTFWKVLQATPPIQPRARAKNWTWFQYRSSFNRYTLYMCIYPLLWDSLLGPSVCRCCCKLLQILLQNHCNIEPIFAQSILGLRGYKMLCSLTGFKNQNHF